MERERKGKTSRGVISTLHPAPAKAAARLQRLGESRAGVGGRTTVLGAPDGRRGAPFLGAAVEHAEAAAGDLVVSLRISITQSYTITTI